MARASRTATTATTTGPRAVPATPRGGWWRRPLAWLLILLACLAAPLAVLAGWARWNVLDADRYVRTVQPVVADPVVQEALTAAGLTAFGLEAGAGAESQSTGAGAEQTAAAAPVGGALPATPGVSADGATGTASAAPLPRPPVLGDPAAGAGNDPAVADAPAAVPGAIEPPVQEAVAAVVRSEAFAETWGEANRTAHASLTDRERAGEPIVLDLAPLATEVSGRLGPQGAAVAPDPAALRIEVVDAATADRLRAVLGRIGWLGIVLPIVAVLAAALAVWIAPHRLAVVRRLAFGTLLTTVAALLALLVAATGVEGRAAGPAAPVAGAAIGAVLWTPTLWLAALALVGLVVAAVGVGLVWLRRRRAVRAAPAAPAA